MRYQLVIFDFDGTLADSFPYFLKTINTLALTYHFPPIQPGQIEQARGMEARQLMRAARLPAWKIPLMARDFIRLMATDIHQIQLFEGVAPLLEELHHRGVQLAIVSSNSEANIREVLGSKTAGLIGYYGCGTSLFGKQHKFKRAMAHWGLGPHQVLCVGDEVRDSQAAAKANMAFGAVTWGYARADVLAAQPGIFLFKRLDDICQLVLGRGATQ
ncbi:HAD hydrolase-like protein [Fibrella forsythiae]|uniref:HAD hydrolase-like protein n=1 Tax=Fibrella forsythiae TaxID=2817061 RepID=A0ABS3JT84_9BACT|nr:HAD hydrolase-like protein [Fibrella forsythiae]MBO0953215.1 HAD hydrolase-like protein [Fibrella forsythiae]